MAYSIDGQRHSGTAKIKETSRSDPMAPRCWGAETRHETRSLKRAFAERDRLVTYMLVGDVAQAPRLSAVSGDKRYRGQAYMTGIAVELDTSSKVAVVTSHWIGTGPLRWSARGVGGQP